MLCLSLTPLLVLVLGVSLGAAFPHDTLRKGCRLSKYQNIAPEEQKAVDKMRKEFVNNHKCNTRLFHRKWNAVDLPMSDRVVLVAAELNLTTAMLELPAVPSFAEVRRRPLDFFTQAREDVRGCVDPSHQPSGRLRHWLHKLQAAMRAVSQASGVTAPGVSASARLRGPLQPHFSAEPPFLPAAGQHREHREHGLPEGHHHPARPTSAGQPAVRGPPGQVLKCPECQPTPPPPREGREKRLRCTSS
ncbi:interferon lambda-3-like isoform X1 [Corvus moneduloides]|uniref:interferon lambda-3-like isoform X1 n=1 Tax=Corvus moneduloides TaxID=1196302 RepID=UPI00136291E2|nr:interferon lambda-3-like isoform X1 [Corvus moneduloides]